MNHYAHSIDGPDDPPGKKNNGFSKKNAFGNSKIALDISDATFGALGSTTASGGKWLGKNGKYYSTSWGGNGSTGGRTGALKAASNYKWASKGVVGLNVVIGGVETLNGYQMDGNQFGYNAQHAAASSAGGIIGGWAGAETGAIAGAAVGVWFGGVGAVPGAIIGGIIGGVGGSYAGSAAGEGAVNYYHNK